MRKLIIPILLIAIFAIGCKEANKQENTVETEMDRALVQFEDNGYLVPSTIEPIRDEQMRIKAISAYEYALPIVGIEQWHKGFLQQAEYGDWLLYENRLTKVPIITANTTTPYVMSYVDLSEANYYIEIPAGPLGGVIQDITNRHSLI